LAALEGLIKFMSGSVAKRLEDPTFFDHIRKLRDLLGSTDELSRFMCDSVAKRLGTLNT
jgi:hypothetical protein